MFLVRIRPLQDHYYGLEGVINTNFVSNCFVESFVVLREAFKGKEQNEKRDMSPPFEEEKQLSNRYKL